MVQGSVTRHQGAMTERESIEAFVEGAKKAASCAREMAAEFDDKDWEDTARMLDGMRVNGVKLSQMRGMSRLETMMAANIKQQKFIPQ
jgi:hypothetical protein